MIDFLGKAIRIGDTVAYVVQQRGSHVPVYRIGNVEAVGTDLRGGFARVRIEGGLMQGKLRTIRKPSHTVIIERAEERR
jgi:hypothetical protein